MNRKQMKKQGKHSLKKHYFIFVAACLIAAFLSAEFRSSLNFSSAQTYEQTYEQIENDVSGGGSYTVQTNMRSIGWEDVLRIIAEDDTQAGKEMAEQIKENAISHALTGPSGRASGWACDVRKRMPYGVYDKVEFNEVLRTEGDVFARYMVRLDEILESIKIIEQLIDNIPEGDYALKMKPIIKLPEGRYFRQVEASRGAFGVYIESRGEKYPYRLKFNTPGLMLVGSLDELTRGGKIADLIAIGGSLDYVVPDIDR